MVMETDYSYADDPVGGGMMVPEDSLVLTEADFAADEPGEKRKLHHLGYINQQLPQDWVRQIVRSCGYAQDQILFLTDLPADVRWRRNLGTEWALVVTSQPGDYRTFWDALRDGLRARERAGKGLEG